MTPVRLEPAASRSRIKHSTIVPLRSQDVSFESKNSAMQSSCFYKSPKALPKLCRSFHLKMTGTACTDDARVKVPSFQNVTFLLQYEIFHRDAIHLFFVCMKMFLTAVIKDEHASDDSLQSDSSFLLCIMMTDTTSS